MAITKNIILITPEQTAFSGHFPVNDSRASKRFDHEAHVIIKNCDCGSYTYGRMYNYSRGGIYFESDMAFKPGSCVRVDIEDSNSGPAADHYYATVMWCKEIVDAVVLHEFGIGIEFDRTMNGSGGGGKLRIIQGGARHKAI